MIRSRALLRLASSLCVAPGGHAPSGKTASSRHATFASRLVISAVGIGETNARHALGSYHTMETADTFRRIYDNCCSPSRHLRCLFDETTTITRLQLSAGCAVGCGYQRGACSHGLSCWRHSSNDVCITQAVHGVCIVTQALAV